MSDTGLDGPMTWIVPTPHVADGPLTGPDRPILEAYLGWQRQTLLNICAGLTGEQLAARPLPASTLSLLGLIRHLAKVERIWFRQRAAGEPIEAMYDLSLGKDHDFDALDPAEAPAAVARLQAEWRAADSAAAALDFDHVFDHRGEAMSLRMSYVHMVGEYARHNGHADLLREHLDGVTGR
jgi:uncharacterized damage-inducible protein DinB